MPRSALRCAPWVLTIFIAASMAGCASHPKPMAPAPVTPPPPPPSSRYSAPPPGAVQTEILPGSIKDFSLNVGDRIYFELNQYMISSAGAAVLSAQANWLNRYPAVQVRIEGNADERGTEVYNLALGARRADAVKTFLVEHAVSPSRITTISYGKERPIDPGAGEGAWARNRNAHTAITHGAN